MPKSYCHLTYEERCQIEALKKCGLSVALVAEQLGRSRATIYREINRNSGKRGYRHKQAQEKTKIRRRAASSVPWRFTPVRWAEVVTELKRGLSPEQISGRFQLEGRPVGRQQIYNFVHADRRAGGDLWTKLRRRGKKSNKKGKSHAGRGHIPGRVDISERPAIVEEKVRISDWEADTIVGKGHSGALVSLVDRAAKYTFLGRVDKKTKEEVCSTSIRLLGSGKIPVHTITADNGKEFADHNRVAKALKAQFFFAEPYHSVNRHSTVTHYQRPNMTHPQEGGTGGEVSEILFFSAKSKRHPSLIYSMQIIPVCLSIVARRKGVSATRRGGLNWTPISLLVGHPCKLFHNHS